VLPAGADATLRPLPGRDPPPAARVLCPPNAPRKSFAVEAIDAPIPILGHPGKVYVLAEDRDAVVSGERAAEPLVLHASVGDCIVIELSNRTSAPQGAVSMHAADMLAYDPRDSAGVQVGRNESGQAVAPGQSRTLTFYAHPEIGETTALLRDWGDVLRNPSDGLYGAIVVGPRGATFTDPATGADIASRSSWRADVAVPGGTSYRDFTLLVQDQDEVIGTAQMPTPSRFRARSASTTRLRRWRSAWRSTRTRRASFQVSCMAIRQRRCWKPSPATPCRSTSWRRPVSRRTSSASKAIAGLRMGSPGHPAHQLDAAGRP